MSRIPAFCVRVSQEERIEYLDFAKRCRCSVQDCMRELMRKTMARTAQQRVAENWDYRVTTPVNESEYFAQMQDAGTSTTTTCDDPKRVGYSRTEQAEQRHARSHVSQFTAVARESHSRKSARGMALRPVQRRATA